MGTVQSCLRGSSTLVDGTSGQDSFEPIQQQTVRAGPGSFFQLSVKHDQHASTNIAGTFASKVNGCCEQRVAQQTASQPASAPWPLPSEDCLEEQHDMLQLRSLSAQQQTMAPCLQQQQQHLKASQPAATVRWLQQQQPIAAQPPGQQQQQQPRDQQWQGQQQQQQQVHLAGLPVEKAPWVQPHTEALQVQQAEPPQDKLLHDQQQQQQQQWQRVLQQQQSQQQRSPDEICVWQDSSTEPQQRHSGQELLHNGMLKHTRTTSAAATSGGGAAAAAGAAAAGAAAAGVKCTPTMADVQRAFKRFNPNSPQPGLLGFASQPWLPLNPHTSGPPRAHCEDERLIVAAQIGELLPHVPPQPLSSILRAVCAVFHVKVAMLVLCGDRCIHIPVAHNTEGDFVGDPSWRNSFCGWLLSSDQPSVMAVTDALQDARFRDNQHVAGGVIRSYFGAPLVSSTGHLLGTLAFVDSVPRVFDTSSLQVLVNLAEIVVRELELHIVKQQQQQPQQQQQQQQSHDHQLPQQQQQQQQQYHSWYSEPGLTAAAAAGGRCDGIVTSSFTAEHQLAASKVHQQYNMLLRTPECVTSAVALVDTSHTGWRILHSNSSWDQLLYQFKQHCINTITSNGNSQCTHSSSSSSQPQQQQQQQQHGNSSSSWHGCVNVADSDLLWDVFDPSQLNQVHQFTHNPSCSSSSSGTPNPHILNCYNNCYNTGGSAGSAAYPAPVSMKQQVLSQIQGRQSFCLTNMRLSKRLGGARVELSFRCGGFSSLDGAAAVCLPAAQPDATELPNALSLQSFERPKKPNHESDMLQAGSSSSGSTPFAAAAQNPSAMTAAASGCLYFVTVKMLEDPAAAAAVAVAAAAARKGNSCRSSSSSCFGGVVRADCDGSAVNDNGYLEMTTRGSSSCKKEQHTEQPGSSSASSGSGSTSSSAVQGDNCYVKKDSSAAQSMLPLPEGATTSSHDIIIISSSSSGEHYYSCRSTVQSSSSNLYSSGGNALSTCSSGCLVRPTLLPCRFPQLAGPGLSQTGFCLHNQQQQQGLGLESGCFNPHGFVVFSSLDVPLRRSCSTGVMLNCGSSSSNGSESIQKASGTDGTASASGPLNECNASHVSAGSSGSTDSHRSPPSSSTTPNQTPANKPSSSSSCCYNTGSSSGSVQGYSTSAICADLVCSKLSRLTLGGPIFAGSHGRVFRAEYCGEKVAVKVLPGSTVLPGTGGTGLSLSALLSQQLQHPNLVKTLAWAVVAGQREELVRQQPAPSAAAAAAAQLCSCCCCCCCGAAAAVAPTGQTWLVQEYCDKGCLQDAIDSGWLLQGPRSCVHGKVDALRVMATAAEVAAAVAALHADDVIHGDLAAVNVLLSSAAGAMALAGRGFVAKLTNFGLAQHAHHTSSSSSSSGLRANPYGSLSHLSPEVLAGGPPSKAADVYSFGVLLWQMVTGSRPWAGLPHASIIQAVCDYKRQLEFPDDACPAPLVLLARACMVRNPAERPCFKDILEVLQWH